MENLTSRSIALIFLSITYFTCHAVPDTSYSVVVDHSPAQERTFDILGNLFSNAAPKIPPTRFFANYFDQPSFGQPSFGQGSPFAQAAVTDPALGCGAAPPVCQQTKYRSLDGSCNNLQNPAWGTAQSRYARLLPPKYGDDISAPTTSVTNSPLPNARLISLLVFPEEDVTDPLWTLANMQWGQIVTHDMSMLAGSTQSKKHNTRCCTDDGQLIDKARAHTTCYAILVPQGDPIHSPSNTQCINFVRTVTDRDRKCRGSQNKPAEQLTVVTAYMDLSLVYGNSDVQSATLRAFEGGRMLVEVRNGKQWPPSSPNASAACDIQSSNEVCYLAGDVRVNQNPQLTVLQIILLREHNRLADELYSMNPHWTDERVFQEARSINIAQYQHINYYEWLPIYLGTENMIKNRLIYKTSGYVDDYDHSIDAGVLNSHATAAFRYFHSLIAGHLDLINPHRGSFGSLRLSDWLNRPTIIEQGNNLDELTIGMATQPQQLSDINFDPEIKEFLFRGNNRFGTDLRALDIQRNRDHGLASYNDYRAFCGLQRAHSFEDLVDFISPKNINLLKSLYEHPEDIDLTVGGSLEAHVAGSLSGPTFLCILTEQFYRTRVGDRFFYENGHTHQGFTIEQLNEIRKASVSRLFCDNGDNIDSMQPRGFERVSNTNEVFPCQHLPYVDLSRWQEM